MIEVMLALGLAVWVVVNIYYVRQPQASLLHPATFYSAVHGFLFVFRPIYGYFDPFRTIYIIYGFQPTTMERVLALAATQLSFVAFMLVAIRIGAQSPNRTSVLEDRRRSLRMPVLAVAAVLGPIALYSKLSAIGAKLSGTSSMIMDAETGLTYNTENVGWFTEAQNMLVPITVMIAWIFRFKPVALLPLGIYGLLQASTGGRGVLLFALIAAAMLWLYDQRRRWPEWRFVAVGMAAIAIFYFVGQDRGAGVRSIVTGEEYVERITAESETFRGLDHMDYANMEYVEFVVWYVPERSDTYGYFIDNLQLFTEPVPRVLWPGKPLGPPIQMFDFYEYGTPIGMSTAVPGYGYLQGGLLGAAAWAAFLGLLFGLGYRIFARRGDSPLITLAWVIMLSATILFFRDGGLLTIARNSPFLLGPIGAVWLLCAFLARQNRSLAMQGSLAPMRISRRSPVVEEQPSGTAMEAPPVAVDVHSSPEPEQLVPRAWRGRADRTAQPGRTMKHGHE